MAPSDSSSGSEDDYFDSSSASDARSPRRCPHLLTYALILANVASFLAMLYWQETPWSLAPLSENPFLGPQTTVLLKFGALAPQEARAQHEWWRLGSCCFVHAGVVHLLMNSIALKQLGSAMEERFGACRTGVLYVLAGLFGSMCAAIFSKDRVTVGASGAILGLFGGFWSTLLQGSCYDGCGACCQHLCMLVWNTVFIVVLSLLPYVQVWAHFGGLVMGFLVGNVLLIRELDDDERIRIRQCVLGAISLGAAVLTFGVATLALSRDVDMYELWPEARFLNCFDTPFWKCCQFASVSCGVARKQSQETAAYEYWVVCNSGEATAAALHSQTAVQTVSLDAPDVHGPYSQQPDRCDCVEHCGEL